MQRLTFDRHVLAAALVVLLGTVGASVPGSKPVTATAAAAGPTSYQTVEQRFPVGGPSMETARRIAREQWGADPCGGQVEVTWTLLDATSLASAAWNNPSGAWANPAANYDCTIAFNVHGLFDWERFCTVMAHEYGHLLGQQHPLDSGRLMSGHYSTPLPACTATTDPGQPAPAPAPKHAGAPGPQAHRSEGRCRTQRSARRGGSGSRAQGSVAHRRSVPATIRRKPARPQHACRAVGRVRTSR